MYNLKQSLQDIIT